MRSQLAIWMLLLGTGLGTLLAVPAVPSSDQAKIAQLINQLGSANFRERDAATKELDAIGEPALNALRKAAKNSDMEIANRATGLAAKIEQRATNAQLIAPTYVELSFKDTPVEQAVAELAKKSGYAIILGGDKSKLAQRTVTFETGKVPFWLAFDMLCEKANLVESDLINQPSPMGQPLPPLPVIPAPIQIRPLPAQIKPINIKPLPVKPVEKEEQKPNVEKLKGLDPPQIPEGFAADDKADEEAKRRAEAAAEEAAKKAEEAQRALQQAQVQVQVQRKQAIINGRPFGRPVPGNGANPTIVLVDGKPNTAPVHVEGAVRVRALDKPNLLANFGPIPQGEFGLLFEVKAEPKLQLEQLTGVKIDRAVDNYDQVLDQSLVAALDGAYAVDQIGQKVKYIGSALQGPNQSGQMIVPVRLKKGEKESKSFKEIKGTVSLQIRTPMEDLVSIENILKAKGESTRGKGGCELKIVDVKKEANGDIKIEVDLQHSNEIQPKNGWNNMGGFQLGGNIQINGNVQIQIGQGGGVVQAVPAKGGPVVNNLGLELLDDKGVPVPMIQMQNTKMQFMNNGRSNSAIMTYRPKKDQEAAKLVFQGTRPAVVDVPFVLKDVTVK